MSKKFSEILRQVQANIYPPDGSTPYDPRWAMYRNDPDARQQLMISLMIQMQEQHEQQIYSLAVQLAKLEEAVGQIASAFKPAATAAPQQQGQPGTVPVSEGNETAIVNGEEYEVMPQTSAVNGPILPVPQPARPVNANAGIPIAVPAAPVNPLAGGQVTMTAFAPAQVSGTQPPRS